MSVAGAAAGELDRVAREELDRPPERPSRRRGWFLRVYTFLVIVYLFVPIAVMILFGFNNLKGRYNFTWQGFTLRHYRQLFKYPGLSSSLRNSLIIALITTIVATILGTLIALALTRYNFRGRSSTNLFIFLPMATPEVVMGASLLALFVTAGTARGFPTILIAHIMFTISFVVVTVKARTHGFNRQWEEAARDLGATPWVTFWKVTFPLILPGIIGAAALSASLSIDDYVVTSFNSGQTSTFPLWVWGSAQRGVPPQVNVMGTIIFVSGVLLALGTVVIQRRRA
jgi:spermidine/putrescine transport system permease protein